MSILGKLVAVMNDIKNPTKNAENGHFHNKYATLDVICDEVRESCKKHGIAIMQTPTTILADCADGTKSAFVLRAVAIADGEEKTLGDYPINPTKNDPQGIGSAITYARRYQLCSILGIAAEDDDDGNAASAKQESAKQILPPKPVAPAKTDARSSIIKEFDDKMMRGALMVVLQGVSLEKEEQIAYAKKHWNITSLKDASEEVIADLYKRVCK